MGQKIYFGYLVVFLMLGAMIADAQADPDMRLEKGAVFLRGKWSPTDVHSKEELAHLPLVEVHCFKAQNFCMQAIASAHADEPGLAVQYYKITHWDKSSIIAENQDFSCTTNQIRIILKENITLAVDTPKKAAKPLSDACSELGKGIKYRLIGEALGPVEVTDRQITHP